MVVRRKGQKGVVVFFGFTTEVRTTRLFYIYGSWVSKRILILRDRIPNFSHIIPFIFLKVSLTPLCMLVTELESKRCYCGVPGDRKDKKVFKIQSFSKKS